MKTVIRITQKKNPDYIRIDPDFESGSDNPDRNRKPDWIYKWSAIILARIHNAGQNYKLCNIKFSCLADKKFFARWPNYFPVSRDVNFGQNYKFGQNYPRPRNLHNSNFIKYFSLKQFHITVFQHCLRLLFNISL